MRIKLLFLCCLILGACSDNTPNAYTPTEEELREALEAGNEAVAMDWDVDNWDEVNWR